MSNLKVKKTWRKNVFLAKNKEIKRKEKHHEKWFCEEEKTVWSRRIVQEWITREDSKHVIIFLYSNKLQYENEEKKTTNVRKTKEW